MLFYNSNGVRNFTFHMFINILNHCCTIHAHNMGPSAHLIQFYCRYFAHTNVYIMIHVNERLEYLLAWAPEANVDWYGEILPPSLPPSPPLLSPFSPLPSP